jgi:hypothetical protein
MPNNYLRFEVMKNEKEAGKIYKKKFILEITFFFYNLLGSVW